MILVIVNLLMHYSKLPPILNGKQKSPYCKTTRKGAIPSLEIVINSKKTLSGWDLSCPPIKTPAFCSEESAPQMCDGLSM